MSDNSANNKRIAKNTLMLYIRMLLIMGVTLYTSRVVLNTLGVVDFGIYNIIASVIVLFSFLNSAMVASSQRFLNFALGKKDLKEVQKVFSTSLTAFLILAILVLILAETIGLWFVSTQISIPTERYDAAIAVYHISIITTCIQILRIPYNASIIAYERMSFYAYNSIIEAMLKLLIVWLLTLASFDKLVYYAYLLLAVTVVINISYIAYCRKNISTTRFILGKDIASLKKLTMFSGWNLIGSIADIGYTQGTNIILNIFYGVSLNAAMGIANQIKSAVYSFVRNLQSAANPQIVKSYAAEDYEHFRNLFFNISKYSYFLMFILAVPILLNIDYVLTLWLVNPPEYSSTFATLTIVFCCLDCLIGPLWITMQANGNIRNYQIITNLIILLNVPFSYIALYMGFAPNSILIIQILLSIVSILVRLLLSRKYTGISIRSYLSNVIFPIGLVTIISLPIPVIISLYTNDFTRFIFTGICSMFTTLFAIYWVGIKSTERNLVKQFIKTKIKR